jgi:hypothetical protein
MHACAFDVNRYRRNALYDLKNFTIFFLSPGTEENDTKFFFASDQPQNTFFERFKRFEKKIFFWPTMGFWV